MDFISHSVMKIVGKSIKVLLLQNIFKNGKITAIIYNELSKIVDRSITTNRAKTMGLLHYFKRIINFNFQFGKTANSSIVYYFLLLCRHFHR